MRGNLLNARSTNRDVRSLGLLRSCAVPARMFIKYLEKKWEFFDKMTKMLAYIKNTGIISRKKKYLCSG